MLRSADHQETEGVVSESSVEALEQRPADNHDTDADLELQLKQDVTFAGHMCKRTIQERHGVICVNNPKGKALFAVVRGHGLFLYKDPACFQRVRPQEAISLRRCFIDAEAQVPQEGAFGKAAALLQTRSKEKGKEFYAHTVAMYTSAGTERDFALSFSCQKDLEHFASICEGMGLSEKPPKQDTAKDKKKKMFGTWRGQGSRDFTEKRMPTFEVSLQEYLSLRPDLQVPILVTKCINEVVSRGMDIEGIYRMAGGKAVIQSLRELFDENERSVDISDEDEWADIHCVSNLLKQYLRSLPESLGTHMLYAHFITAATTYTGEARTAALAFLVQCHLPAANITLFKQLMSHLRAVVAMSDVNKMKTENLAIVFGPTLFFPNNADPLEMIGATAGQCKIVEVMLDKYDTVFVDAIDLATCPPEVQTLRDILGDGQHTEPNPSSNSAANDTEPHPNSNSAANDTTLDPADEMLEHGYASPMMSDVAPRIKTKRLNSMQCIESSSNKSETALEDTDTNLSASQVSLGSGRVLKPDSLDRLSIASISADDFAALTAQRMKDGLAVDKDTTGWYTIPEAHTDDGSKDKDTTADTGNFDSPAGAIGAHDSAVSSEGAGDVAQAEGGVLVETPADNLVSGSPVVSDTHTAAAPPRPTAGPPRPKTAPPRKPSNECMAVQQDSDTPAHEPSEGAVGAQAQQCAVKAGDTGEEMSDIRVPSTADTADADTETVDVVGEVVVDDAAIQEVIAVETVNTQEGPQESVPPETTSAQEPTGSDLTAKEHTAAVEVTEEVDSSTTSIAQTLSNDVTVTVDTVKGTAAPVAAPRPRTTSTHSQHSVNVSSAPAESAAATTDPTDTSTITTTEQDNEEQTAPTQPIDLMKVLKQCDGDSNRSGSAVAEYMLQTLSKKSSECVCHGMDLQTEDQPPRAACEGKCVSAGCAVPPTVEEIADDVFHMIEQLGAFSPSLAAAPSDA